MSNGQAAQGDQQGGSGDAQKLKVGEKEYGPQDVENLISQVSSFTEKQSELSDVLATCEKYGITPKDFVLNAEGAFAAMNELIKQGVVNERGELVQKANPKTPPKDDDDGDEDEGKNLLELLKGKKGEKEGGSKAMDVIQKALQPLTKTFEDKLSELESLQTSLIRQSFADRLIRKYGGDGLTEADTDIIFEKAMKDRSKDLDQHTKAFLEEKKNVHQKQREDFAKEFGIDLKKHDENKLKEKGGGPGGGVFPQFEGKKFSLRHKGEGFVSPRAAATEYFKALEEND